MQVPNVIFAPEIGSVKVPLQTSLGIAHVKPTLLFGYVITRIKLLVILWHSHNVAPVRENECNGQGKQLIEPFSYAYVPAGHFVAIPPLQ